MPALCSGVPRSSAAIQAPVFCGPDRTGALMGVRWAGDEPFLMSINIRVTGHVGKKMPKPRSRVKLVFVKRKFC